MSEHFMYMLARKQLILSPAPASPLLFAVAIHVDISLVMRTNTLQYYVTNRSGAFENKVKKSVVNFFQYQGMGWHHPKACFLPDSEDNFNIIRCSSDNKVSVSFCPMLPGYFGYMPIKEFYVLVIKFRLTNFFSFDLSHSNRKHLKHKAKF